MNQANNVFVITLALVLFGYLLKKSDFLTEKDGKVISKFLMHTTFPALLLVSVIRIKLEPNLFVIPFMTVIFSSLMRGIAWFVFRKQSNDLRGLLVMGSGSLRTGLFAFPIIEGIWGREGLMYMIMVDIGNTAVIFFLVYPIGSYFSGKGEGKVPFKDIFKKVIQSPPLQAMTIGLIINGVSLQLPTQKKLKKY